MGPGLLAGAPSLFQQKRSPTTVLRRGRDDLASPCGRERGGDRHRPKSALPERGVLGCHPHPVSPLTKKCPFSLWACMPPALGAASRVILAAPLDLGRSRAPFPAPAADLPHRQQPQQPDHGEAESTAAPPVRRIALHPFAVPYGLLSIPPVQHHLSFSPQKTCSSI